MANGIRPRRAQLADVEGAGEWLLPARGQLLPSAVEPVRQIRLVVAPAAGLRFDQRKKLLRSLDAVRVTRLKDVSLQDDVRLAPAAWKIRARGFRAPHTAVIRREKEVRPRFVADHPEVDPLLDISGQLSVKRSRLRPRIGVGYVSRRRKRRLQARLA